MKMQTAFCGLLLLTTISVATTQMLRWTWEPPSPPPSTNEGANFEQPNTLDEAIHEHRRICTRHHTCTGKMYSVGSFCCGSCTCDIKCAEHGSCCPEMFRNFAQAHDFIQKSRYSCVLTQYLLPEETDYYTGLAYWMITKCDPEYQDLDDIHKCLNPVPDLASVVPVTESAANYRHFRNKHCAYCNFIDKRSPLLEWKLQIQSDRVLSFPNSNLLQELKKMRCNIFFLCPEYFSADECEATPGHMIDTCNVTGLWRAYNEVVKTACESYNDPFNYTYKNVFCYMCNQGSENVQSLLRKGTECQSRDDKPKTPQFSAILDLQFVKDGHNSEILICETNEIQDRYLNVCRRIFCHGGGHLSYGVCISGSEHLNRTCFSVFLKLTPEHPLLILNKIDKLSFAEDISNKSFGAVGVQPDNLGTYPVSTLETNIYFKTDKTGFIEYFVVYRVQDIRTSSDKNAFLDDILARPIVDLNYREEFYMAFEVEPTIYNITVSNGVANIKVPLVLNGTFATKVDRLVSELRYVPNESHICPVEQTVKLTKVHRCPYIKLRTDEIVYDIQNGFLFILGGNSLEKKPVKVLPQWNYEMHESVVYICLEDYLDINNDMILSETLLPNGNAFQPGYSWYLALFIFLLEDRNPS